MRASPEYSDKICSNHLQAKALSFFLPFFSLLQQGVLVAVGTPWLSDFNYTFSNYWPFLVQKIPVFCRSIFHPELTEIKVLP